jgi:AhpD family alkylhydroperoxidase
MMQPTPPVRPYCAWEGAGCSAGLVQAVGGFAVVRLTQALGSCIHHSDRQTGNQGPMTYGRCVSPAARAGSAPITVQRKEKIMASIKMAPEEEATGKVKDVYEDIKSRLGIDFVPNLYKVMASKPDYLEANWNKVKAVMIEAGQLDRLTKEIIAVAVSAVNGCEYWLAVHTSAVQKLGLNDEAVLELMAVVDLFSGFNKLMDGLRVEPDEKPWYGWG